MMMKLDFLEEFIRISDMGYKQGWHELNGGNMSYHLTDADIVSSKQYLNYDAPYRLIEGWNSITGTKVPELAGEYFLVTASRKYFMNIKSRPTECLAIVRLNEEGDKYQTLWGLSKGGKPTSEFSTHLKNHAVKMRVTNGENRVIYHSHPENIIALTFILPLDDVTFTRNLWETYTECPVVFSEGVGVVEWMVPGCDEIAQASQEKMEKHNILIWAHHGLFCSAPTLESAYGLMETVEKAASILVKILSMGGRKQTITVDNLKKLEKDFELTIDKKYLK